MPAAAIPTARRKANGESSEAIASPAAKQPEIRATPVREEDRGFSRLRFRRSSARSVVLLYAREAAKRRNMLAETSTGEMDGRKIRNPRSARHVVKKLMPTRRKSATSFALAKDTTNIEIGSCELYQNELAPLPAGDGPEVDAVDVRGLGRKVEPPVRQ